MNDIFKCPECGHVHDIGKLELWNVYEKECKQTEYDCNGCGKPLIVISIVTGWTFEVEMNE